jgi:hypothetical protein
MELGTESSRSAGRIARAMGKFSTSAGRIARARPGTMVNDFGRWLAGVLSMPSEIPGITCLLF